MKKNSLTLMFLAIASVAVVMSACKKESEPQTNNSTPITNQVVQRLLDFQQQVKYYTENPNVKDGETMSVDDATNDVVDLFNTIYSEPNAYYEQTVRHEFTLYLPTASDGSVLVSDVVALYNQVVSMAKESYHNDGFMENKGYVILTTEIEPQRNGMLKMNFNGTSGIIGRAPDPVDLPFNDADNWKYRAPLGNCDSTVFSDSGADKELQYYVGSAVNRAFPQAPAGFQYVPISPRKIIFNGLDYMNMPFADTIFWRSVEDGECISWMDMNKYYLGELYMVFNKIPEDHDYSIGSIHYVMPDLTIEGQQNENALCSEYYFHNTIVTYCRLELFDINTIPHQPLEY